MRYFTIPSIDSIHYLVCGNLMSQDGFLHHRRCFHENVLILALEGTLWHQAVRRKAFLSLGALYR